jgi:hypothetical protein
MENRILCIELEADEIVAVGTGGEDGVAHRRWLVAEVARAIVDGERFFAVCPSTGDEVDVEVRAGRICAPADLTSGFSLERLRPCRWR